MNKKLVTSILTAGFLFSFVLTTSASAFWPFDALFKKSGDVKAETTEKKMLVGDVGPGGSRAYMTYQTLVTMNDACRRMFSQTYPTPTKVRVTPSAREGYAANGRDVASDKKMAADSTESINRMYELEFGIDSKSERELTAIYTNLKARCDNIANLTTRMQKIYKGAIKPTDIVVSPTPAQVCGGIQGKMCPDGYRCSYEDSVSNTDNKRMVGKKIVADATGICVPDKPRPFVTKPSNSLLR